MEEAILEHNDESRLDTQNEEILKNNISMISKQIQEPTS